MTAVSCARVFLVMAVLLSAALLSTEASADSLEARSLEGINGVLVRVSVQVPKPSEFSAQLETRLASSMQARLQQTDVPLVESGAMSAEHPALMLTVSTVKSPEYPVIFGIMCLEVDQVVSLERQPHHRLPAITWLRTRLLMFQEVVSPDRILSTADSMTAEFCSDYRAANPPAPHADGVTAIPLFFAK
jgi:hypothetical protein